MTPGRYIGIKDREDDGETFYEKTTRLISELSGMFNRFRELGYEIRKKPGAIGFDLWPPLRIPLFVLSVSGLESRHED